MARKPTLYRHRGTWYARFWDYEKGRYAARSLGVPVEGKRERRREAEEAARVMALKLEHEKAETKIKVKDSRAGVSFVQYLNDFWAPDGEYAKEKAGIDNHRLSFSYIYENRRLIINKIAVFPDFQAASLSGVTKLMIRRWMIWRKEQGDSGRVINKAVLCMSVAVKRAFADDMLPVDPFAGIKRAAHTEKKRDILTIEEIERIKDLTVYDARQRLALYLPLCCGLRMGEVRGLLWGDIGEGVLHIRHNWQNKDGLKGCKCGSERDVPMPNIVANLINAVRSSAPLTGEKDFVMSVYPYHPIGKNYLYDSLAFHLFMIGICEKRRRERNIVYHGLRHTYVTMVRMAGVSDFIAQALAGHKDSKMMDRYSHAGRAMDLNAVRLQLEQGFGGA